MGRVVPGKEKRAVKRIVLLFLSACMLLGGCSNAIRLYEAPSAQEERGSGEIEPVELNNAWQRAAYFVDQVYAENSGNVLVSPLSLNVALGLVTEGTTGETAKELYQYLGREDYADWANQYLAYAESLKEESERHSDYTFAYKLANSVWVRKDETLKKEYLVTAHEAFRAQVETADFAGKPEQSAKRINSWCDEHTEGLVKEIVTPDKLTKDLMAIVINSVYFESPWRDKWSLEEREFTALSGKKTRQEMLTDVLTDYFENEKCTAFSKQYYNGFEFIGILPKAEGDFSLGELDLESLMASRTDAYEVHALAPKLEYETKAENVIDVLKAQGVNRVFGGSAEFGEMIEGSNLMISEIIQKCRIEMDEDGTRAAAVTAILMKKSVSIAEPKKKEIKEVFLDRPFAFLIYDSVNDQILFAGKVTSIQ